MTVTALQACEATREASTKSSAEEHLHVDDTLVERQGEVELERNAPAVGKLLLDKYLRKLGPLLFEVLGQILARQVPARTHELTHESMRCARVNVQQP